MNRKIGSVEINKETNVYTVRNGPGEITARSAPIDISSKNIEFKDSFGIKICGLEKVPGKSNQYNVFMFGNFDRRVMVLLPLLLTKI